MRTSAPRALPDRVDDSPARVRRRDKLRDENAWIDNNPRPRSDATLAPHRAPLLEPTCLARTTSMNEPVDVHRHGYSNSHAVAAPGDETVRCSETAELFWISTVRPQRDADRCSGVRLAGSAVFRSRAGSRLCSRTAVGRGRNQVAAGFGALRANLGFGAGRAPKRRVNQPSTAPPETIATLRNGTRKMALELNSGDIVVVRAGEIHPGQRHRDRGMGDGRRVGDHRGVSASDRESGSSDRSAVTAGARVVSESIVVESPKWLIHTRRLRLGKWRRRERRSQRW